MTAKAPSFLNSPHLSSRTRTLLLERMAQEQATPCHLSSDAFSVLQQVCDDILPQTSLLGETSINLAVLIDNALIGPRDGWRFAELPSDLEAWEAGLTTLNAHAHFHHHTPYRELTAEQRGILLDQAHDGTLSDHVPHARLTPAQMTLWSGDLRADIIGSFLSHPIAQEALGISATLTGGDEQLQGFEHVGPNERDPFEPRVTGRAKTNPSSTS